MKKQNTNPNSNFKIALAVILIFWLVGGRSQKVYQAKYLDNYDGDTANLLIQIPSESDEYEYEEKKIKARLWRVDTYELRKKSQTEEENEMAKAAKSFTEAKLKNNTFTVELIYKERRRQYWQRNRKGRWVVIIRLEGEEYRLGQLLKNKGWTSGKYEMSAIPKPRIKRWKKKRRRRVRS